jgi:hypothetical protein
MGVTRTQNSLMTSLLGAVYISLRDERQKREINNDNSDLSNP